MANNLPAAVRGRMKLWFVEPRANIFISGIKDVVAEKVILYLIKHCPAESGLMIFKKSKSPPGYKIIEIGNSSGNLVDISGLQLVIEKTL